MNKLVKGAIAGAAGIVLLMGGAGSLAYWNDSATAGPAGGTLINAGTLSITAVNAGTWTKGLYNNAGTQTVAPAAVANISAVKIVPGNRLVYTQTFNLSATGDDLFFTVGSTNGAVVPPASPTAADTALVGVINGSGVTAFSVGTVTGGNVVASTTPGTYKLNAAAGPSTITVTWTINFPFGAVVDNSTKGGVVSLTQGAITVTQVATP